MFTSRSKLQQKTGAHGFGRFEYLQMLVTEFQDTNSPSALEEVMANLANFAYDPVNYGYIRQLNIIDLFLDNITDIHESLAEFAISGLCNLALDHTNKEYIIKNGGISLIISCLSSQNEETVIAAVTTLMFLVTPLSKEEITSSPVVDCMLRFAACENTRLRNVAQVFLEDYCTEQQRRDALNSQSQGLLGIPLPSGKFMHKIATVK